MESGGLCLIKTHGVNSKVVDGFHVLSYMVIKFMVSEVTRLFGQEVFMMWVPGPESHLVVLLIWPTGMDVCMVLGQTMESGGLCLIKTHGVNSKVVDGFHVLSYMVIKFMVSEVTRLFGQEVFMMWVPGPESHLVVLLIWPTGMDVCMVLGQTMESGGLCLIKTHGVNSKVVDGFHVLSYMVIKFMVSEVTRLFGQEVFMMWVPGLKSHLVVLLIWLTGNRD